MSAEAALAAIRGDSQAFGELVRHWQGAVCSVALGILKDVAASEEVAQEAFLTAWQKLPTLEDPASFGPWVRQIARNHALTHRRSRSRREDRVVADSEAVDRAGSEDPYLEHERRQLVQDALDALPDDSRDVMILFYREGESVRQVAELLDLSEAAVKKRLSRARAAIREDVLHQLGDVLAKTAPGGAFTAAVLVALAPAPAAAASATAMAGGSPAGVAGMGGLAVVAFVFGYTLAECTLPARHAPALRRARDLSLLGLVPAIGGALLGPGPGAMGWGLYAAVLVYVHVVVLRGLGEDAEGARLTSSGARLGRTFGLLGLVGGLVVGAAGVGRGLGWW